MVNAFFAPAINLLRTSGSVESNSRRSSSSRSAHSTGSQSTSEHIVIGLRSCLVKGGDCHLGRAGPAVACCLSWEIVSTGISLTATGAIVI